MNFVSSISQRIGEAKAHLLEIPSPEIGKQNRIKTIHASLGIEGNTLSREQITAIIDNKRVAGPEQDIIEARNAVKVYNRLKEYDPFKPGTFISAHREMMNGLIDNPGKYRTKAVGIMHGSRVAHLAPKSVNVPYLMKDLFKYLKTADELYLIKSCVFHYEVEFIHPFMDGNGRMGRLWQTLILMSEYPLFEFLPVETLVRESREEYYKALSMSDQSGQSTVFIEYMLGIIDRALADLLQLKSRKLTAYGRLEYFLSQGMEEFSRKDYMDVFRDISPATASRDLHNGVKKGIIKRTGDKNTARYKSR